MELRIFTDILQSSQQMTEFEDVLKSIYLIELPGVDSSDDIDSLLDKTLAVFNQNLDKALAVFVQTQGKRDALSLSAAASFPVSSSSFLYKFFPNNVLGETKGFWREAIKAQCIVSAMYTLEDALFSNADVTITARSFFKNFREKGILTARRDGLISDDCETKKRTETSDHTKDTEEGNLASAKIKSIRKQFNDEEYKTFFKNERPGEGKTDNVNDIKLLNYDVLEVLMKFREKSPKGYEVDYFAKKMHRLYNGEAKAVSALEYVEFFDKACRDALGRVPRDKDSKEEKMDYLIKVYKLERYYNFSLNKMALRCFMDFCERHKEILWDFLDEDFYELFRDMSLMPNVFTRDIMYRWLFDQLDKMLVGKTSVSEVFRAWLRESKRLIHIASGVLFPFMEKTFMSLFVNRYGCTDIPGIWRDIDELVDYVAQDGKYLNILEPCLTYIDGNKWNAVFDKYVFNRDIQSTENAGCIKRAPLYDEIQLRAYNRGYDEIIVGNYSYTAWSTENKEYISEYNYGFINSDMSEMTYEEKKDYANKLLEKAGAKKTIITEEENDRANRGGLDKHRLELFIVKMKRMDEVATDYIGKNQKKTNDLLYAIIDGEMHLGKGYAPIPSVFDREWLESRQEIRSKILDVVLAMWLDGRTVEGIREHMENQANMVRGIITESQGNICVKVERK